MIFGFAGLAGPLGVGVGVAVGCGSAGAGSGVAAGSAPSTAAASTAATTTVVPAAKPATARVSRTRMASPSRLTVTRAPPDEKTCSPALSPRSTPPTTRRVTDPE